MRILIAEDEKDLNHILVQKLTQDGYSVDNCYDGQEAMDILTYTKYDAVILAGRAYPVTSGTDCIGVQHCRTLCGCWYGIKKWDESYPSHYSGSACTAVY